MNFQRGRQRDEPEINFIPLIDLLLVVLIFLVVSSTYTRFGSLGLSLPQSNQQESSNAALNDTRVIELAITAQGGYQIGAENLADNQYAELAKHLKAAQGDAKNSVLMIHADALATHQSVLHAMDAASAAGIKHVRFVTTKAPS